MIKIGVMGYGVVGSGVVEVFEKNKTLICSRVGVPLEISRILDIAEFPDDKYKSKITKDFNHILDDDDIKIVVETMGGIRHAYDYVKQLLSNGKSVVTSNKELVSVHGSELLQLANIHGVSFLFEASVGGGIPIIRPLVNCLAANEIYEITAILNGTTNYILTQIFSDTSDDMSFEKALKQAQSLGYAESNPSDDINGTDSCRKLSILSSIVTGVHVRPEWINTVGIRDISQEDIKYAKKSDCVIKLLARFIKKENIYNIYVEPHLVNKDSYFARVSDVFNAVELKGDAVGEVIFYGKGAGKEPTASAVIADIIDIVKNHGIKRETLWKTSGESFITAISNSVGYKFY